MEIHYTYKAAADLKSLPRTVQKRIASKMRFYGEQKNPLRFVERLSEPLEGEYRFRIGKYRLIFDVVRDKIFILKVRKRDEAYD